MPMKTKQKLNKVISVVDKPATMTTQTVLLHSFSCEWSQFPPDQTLCVNTTSPNALSANQICFHCPYRSLFFFQNQECVDTGDCLGLRIIQYISWVNIAIGCFGTVCNILCLLVLLWGNKRVFSLSLRILLVFLTIFDLLTNLGVTALSILFQIDINNSKRDQVFQFAALSTFVLVLVTRTGSVYFTVLITFQRYCVVSHPIRSRHWFSTQYTLFYSFATLFISILFSSVHWLDFKWVHKSEYSGIVDLSQLPYYHDYEIIFEYTDFGAWFNNSIYAKVGTWFEFVIPILVLLVLNGLLFRRINQAGRIRKEMQNSVRNTNVVSSVEIAGARMCAWVVTFLIGCNAVGILVSCAFRGEKVLHREMIYITFAFVSLNASVNFVIYCWHGKRFRESFAELFCGKVMSTEFVSGRTTVRRPSSNNIRHKPLLSRLETI